VNDGKDAKKKCSGMSLHERFEIDGVTGEEMKYSLRTCRDLTHTVTAGRLYVWNQSSAMGGAALAMRTRNTERMGCQYAAKAATSIRIGAAIPRLSCESSYCFFYEPAINGEYLDEYEYNGVKPNRRVSEVSQTRRTWKPLPEIASGVCFYWG
jgi:hypothetical protein